MTKELRTPRLVLFPATTRLLRAELSGRDALARQISARVPPEWPPDLYDEAAIRYSLDLLIANPEHAGWSFYYFTLPEGDGTVLVGLGGFKGAPDADGVVEIGYSVLRPWRRQGFATEAVRAFLAHAFADPRVTFVLAETFPELVSSIGVLEKCGFTPAGEGSEPGVIRFALERPPDGDSA
jgi:RimJ/RimL family protein N-acetyltransferase